MRRSSFAFLFGLLLVLGVARDSRAQDFRAHVQGAVTDSSKAGIAEASVTLFNINTGVKMAAVTNDTGLYRFDYVDPGTYTLTVEHPGFNKFSQENFQIQAQGDITVNATLTVGGVQETVTVAGSPVEVQFNNTNVTLTIDTKLADELPRFERNPFKLSLLDPSTVEQRRSERLRRSGNSQSHSGTLVRHFEIPDLVALCDADQSGSLPRLARPHFLGYRQHTLEAVPDSRTVQCRAEGGGV